MPNDQNWVENKEKEKFNLIITISLAFLGIIISLLIPTLIALNLEYYDLGSLPENELNHLNDHIIFGFLSFVLFLIIFILTIIIQLYLSISKKEISKNGINVFLLFCTVIILISLYFLVLSINNLLLLVGIQIEFICSSFILGFLISLIVFFVVVLTSSEESEEEGEITRKK